MAEVVKPKNDHEALMLLYQAVIGNGTEGIVARQQRLEEKLDAHTKWHLAQRGAIALALGGWIVALGAAGVAIFGGGS